MLIGGGGRDIFIGGYGTDTIVGNSGDALLIGGTTAFDIDDSDFAQIINIMARDWSEGLIAILSEWNSERDFTTRMNNILDGSGSSDRLNGLYFLQKDATVFDDSMPDYLTGSSGANWLYDDDGPWRIALSPSYQSNQVRLDIGNSQAHARGNERHALRDGEYIFFSASHGP